MQQTENELHLLISGVRRFRRDRLLGSFESPTQRTPELAQSLVEPTGQEIDSSTHWLALALCQFVRRRKKAFRNAQREVSGGRSSEAPKVRLTELSLLCVNVLRPIGVQQRRRLR
jgi:hypothetical protein